MDLSRATIASEHEGNLAVSVDSPLQPTSVTLTLRVVRHGITAWNAEGRLQGHTDVPLSPEGRTQALRLGQRFSDAAAINAPPSRFSTPPDFVFTSDLGRAIETSSIIAASYDLPADKIQVTDGLRERSFGPWEGFTAEEAKIHFGATRSHRDEGESRESVWLRMGLVLERLWNTGTNHGTRDGCILVVGHGGSLREFTCQAIVLPLSAAGHFYLDNTGLSILELRGSSFNKRHGQMLLWNDISHLDREPVAS